MRKTHGFSPWYSHDPCSNFLPCGYNAIQAIQVGRSHLQRVVLIFRRELRKASGHGCLGDLTKGWCTAAKTAGKAEWVWWLKGYFGIFWILLPCSGSTALYWLWSLGGLWWKAWFLPVSSWAWWFLLQERLSTWATWGLKTSTVSPVTEKTRGQSKHPWWKLSWRSKLHCNSCYLPRLLLWTITRVQLIQYYDACSIIKLLNPIDNCTAHWTDRSGPYGPWHQVAPPRRNPCFVIPLKLAPAAPLMYHDWHVQSSKQGTHKHQPG